MDAYIYQADLHCEDCGKAIQQNFHASTADPASSDSDQYPQGPYPNGGGEADTPQHCGSCGLFLENPLTEDGNDYVRDSVAEYLADNTNGNREVLKEWAERYDYLELVI